MDLPQEVVCVDYVLYYLAAKNYIELIVLERNALRRIACDRVKPKTTNSLSCGLRNIDSVKVSMRDHT